MVSKWRCLKELGLEYRCYELCEIPVDRNTGRRETTVMVDDDGRKGKSQRRQPLGKG